MTHRINPETNHLLDEKTSLKNETFRNEFPLTIGMAMGLLSRLLVEPDLLALYEKRKLTRAQIIAAREMLMIVAQCFYEDENGN